MSSETDLSQQLRERRLDLGLSLRQLARRTDTSAATLSRYENGWTRFEVYTLRKLATALDCELDVKLVPKHRSESRPRIAEVARKIGRLFWDRPLESGHLEKNTLWVVERVLEYGNLDDIASLVGLLGREAFLHRVSEARFSSDRTRVFWEHVLRKEGMTCTRKFSRREVATSWRSSRS
ncbi:MAG: helix-turn-helix domain-containing protein [bacterium]|nr:helix-turn-helix domain-containing protein [bacterium]